MQGLTTAPRDHLTAEQVESLLRDADAVTVGKGLELVDESLNVIADISDDLESGTVTRAAFATLHGSCRLVLSKADLTWSNTIARPYTTLSDGVITARFNMGAYYLSSPRRRLGGDPVMFDVDGYDVLDRLDTHVGESYSVDVDTDYLEQVELVLSNVGYPPGSYIIDQTRAGTLLPAAKSYPMDEQTTWLNIVNDLLGAIGYQGIWSDWDGRLRIEPYLVPNDRAVEWVYDLSRYRVPDEHPIVEIVLSTKSMLGTDRVLLSDLYDTPNRWVAIRGNNVDGATPVDGDGVFEFNNVNVGPSSQEARDRVITKVWTVDAADQAALENRAMVTVDADMRASNKLDLTSFPNPLHWHFDKMTLIDPDTLGTVDVLGTDWTYDLGGADMKQLWTML